MIDEEDWSSMEVDVKGAAFEGLLEKVRRGRQKGGGAQYFTPRVLIQSIVQRLCGPILGRRKEYKNLRPRLRYFGLF